MKQKKRKHPDYHTLVRNTDVSNITRFHVELAKYIIKHRFEAMKMFVKLVSRNDILSNGQRMC